MTRQAPCFCLSGPTPFSVVVRQTPSVKLMITYLPETGGSINYTQLLGKRNM